MKKSRLVTPGPMMVPPEALLELAKPIIHHRTPECQATIEEAIEGLKKSVLTEQDMVIFASSGTGAMEASVANVLNPGDTAIVINAGKWGQRWQELCEVYGANLVVLKAEYGQVITPDQVEQALKDNPNAKAVYTTLCETSTGVAHDIEAIGKIVAQTDALMVVDGISGVGAMECRFDDWQIDLLAVGSQKAFMLPPGLAFLAVSAKAKKVVESTDKPKAYYFDLPKFLKSMANYDSPYTPAHTLVAALNQTLKQMLAIGMENIWKETDQMAHAMRAAVDVLGLQTLAAVPVSGLTAIIVPEGISAGDWSKLLESKYGVKVAGGQGELKGKIIRIAHMGYFDSLDLIGVIAALEWTLLELGYSLEPGKAVAAATAVFAENLAPQPA